MTAAEGSDSASPVGQQRAPVFAGESRAKDRSNELSACGVGRGAHGRKGDKLAPMAPLLHCRSLPLTALIVYYASAEASARVQQERDEGAHHTGTTQSLSEAGCLCTLQLTALLTISHRASVTTACFQSHAA